MPTHVNDILRGLNKTNVENRTINCQNVAAREYSMYAVKYFFDIIDIGGHVPFETILGNIKRSYIGSENDHYLPYPIDNVNEGIALCRQLCEHFDISFTENDENELRRKANTEMGYLLIIEREIYIG